MLHFEESVLRNRRAFDVLFVDVLGGRGRKEALGGLDINRELGGREKSTELGLDNRTESGLEVPIIWNK